MKDYYYFSRKYEVYSALAGGLESSSSFLFNSFPRPGDIVLSSAKDEDEGGSYLDAMSPSESVYFSV